LQGACDALLVPAYYDSAEQVEADLLWAGWLAPSGMLAAGLNACEPAVRSGAALVAQARACQAAGCRGVYCYNYGLLTQRRLEWVAQVNSELSG
jgi:hypothetical protein